MTATAPPVASVARVERPALVRPIETADLVAAVDTGVVSLDTAEALAAFVAGRPLDRPLEPSSADEENVRFVTSFNDVFVVIGILLVGGATVIRFADVSLLATAVLVAIEGWGLSEIFSRRWRMALPSIVLVAGFVGAAGAVGATLATRLGAAEVVAAIAAGVAASVAGFFHWRRFGVPISVAGMVAGIGLLAFALLQAAIPTVVATHRMPILLGAGLVTFALAMWWDASDRERRTRRNDVAFWLHVLAAPAIVHPLVFAASDLDVEGFGSDRPLAILAIYAGLAVVALVVDRRALLVSGLLYLGIGTGALVERLGWAAASSGSIAAGIVGAVVLGLAVAWTPLRNLVLGPMPGRIRALVPPPRSPHGRRS